jgi:hypothetical protein
MNKRIKELWEDSDAIEVCYPEQGCPVSVSAKTLETFAELIVRECINKQHELIAKFQTPAPGYTHTFPEFIDGIIGGLEEGIAGIEEHFGVEE